MWPLTVEPGRAAWSENDKSTCVMEDSAVKEEEEEEEDCACSMRGMQAASWGCGSSRSLHRLLPAPSSAAASATPGDSLPAA